MAVTSSVVTVRSEFTAQYPSLILLQASGLPRCGSEAVPNQFVPVTVASPIKASVMDSLATRTRSL